jgi:isochorismate pyruvate lyase
MRAPKDCRDMSELRVEIDALDAELIAQLALRATYIDRAAEIKTGNGLPANIPARVQEVVDNVRVHAGTAGLDQDLVEDIWRRLINWSIAREEVHLDRND